ncbi:branched-chain amino acid transporter AzlC [Lactobacillus sp. S2-2]|uniref:AzlC family ABC transporter permease n=1 Tax=Lactobacillus sp. S2-2 TaxID=2692917 RepID=UPI001F462B84|nr:AzlC family ABC transporter permease [Lactobacillus sp. S2-2]MCF6515481.1 branched-chain amino acid transporter AzlC [Lactobacillus sp. S2-2]
MFDKTFKFAFQKTIPVMTGFLFLGITYGIYMNSEGFNFLYPTLMAASIFGGSIEFLVANLLLTKFNPLFVFFLTLLINSRHIFYGISMLNKYSNVKGIKKFFMIFALCDETFSINYSIDPPKKLNKDKIYLLVTILNYFYWVFGAFLGGLLGSLIAVKIEGLSFVMAALFIVLFLEQVLKEKNHLFSYTGFLLALASLFIFGENLFMLISIIIVILMITFKKEDQTYDNH